MNKISLMFSAVILSAMLLSSFTASEKKEQHQNAWAIKEITIGKQIWMSQNLNVTSFRNGDPIPEADTREEWIKAAANHRPAWCYYRINDKSAGAQYGKLYNWYAVHDPRGLAPEGWHVPSHGEMQKLTGCLGGADTAGLKLKSKDSWNENGNGNNESGFTALPGGYRDAGGVLLDFGYTGSWWTSSEDSTGKAWHHGLDCRSNKIFHYAEDKACGLSVRCIKD